MPSARAAMLTWRARRGRRLILLLLVLLLFALALLLVLLDLILLVLDELFVDVGEQCTRAIAITITTRTCFFSRNLPCTFNFCARAHTHTHTHTVHIAIYSHKRTACRRC
jgi:hypothetical protein